MQQIKGIEGKDRDHLLKFIEDLNIEHNLNWEWLPGKNIFDISI